MIDSLILTEQYVQGGHCVDITLDVTERTLSAQAESFWYMLLMEIYRFVVSNNKTV